jgi:inosine/xanthosine triphosphatase
MAEGESYKVCRVAVGSTNPAKINAVHKAMKLLCDARVEGISVDSGVPPQPTNSRLVLLGALNRALRAIEKLGADYGVGVEAGFDIFAGVPIEFQATVIVDLQGKVSIGFSPGFMLPQQWLKELLEGQELGLIAEQATRRKNIGSQLGLIGYLTYGHVTRSDLTYYATLMALVPRLNTSLYSNLPHYKQLVEELRKEGL